MGGNERTGSEYDKEFSDEEDISETPSLREKLMTFYEKGDASRVLRLMAAATYTPEDRMTTSWDPLLLWVRPERCCIEAIAAHVREGRCRDLVSVGCGTGLLEWLVCALTGISVSGYEINADWWASPYSPPRFIPLVFVEPDAPPPAVPPSHALMCCYFNNGDAFRKYVDSYDGPVMIIIGSIDKNRHTDPRPLDYAHVHPWSLTHTHPITETDLIGFYVRDQLKQEAVRRLRM
ncbi:uncharacterized protein LOC119585157 [Penaeus monodon]|uniref:uncharacterized protein LOC119585157 n=1 Tax=Penaeus monodon TaxID=6687 RepID=UPI0018A7267E|nr:uncharacterized protein LOC119585157 [Penaeus monodon]